jgi:hypothetical protein
VTTAAGAIVAVEGVIGGSLIAGARELAAGMRSATADISLWDASGVFGEVAVTEEKAGRPSARTLLLLYASDLAFRLRREVQPALREQHAIVLAPYVDTAIAFGCAAGIDSGWMTAVFAFAPPATRREYVSGHAPIASDRRGFVEFACEQLTGQRERSTAMVNDADRHLRALLRKRSPSR